MWDRFWIKVKENPETGCWVWTARRDSDGYGHFKFVGCSLRAHRLAYRMLVGSIPSWLEIDHLCRNPACVNPAHMELVAHQENCRRGLVGQAGAIRQRAKTHCPRGHPYDEANTYRSRGGRYCRTCKREAMRRWRRRRHGHDTP